ncbi:MAG: 3-oxoadipate enol-lactonase 2 [Bacteroidetes bacterium]|jgi:pimeloyl-ACP methyl ester carboxylesterase|nr:3-oxoadipate enol-lactonase 2 [Bacteroidota bacterium]
MDTTTKGYNLTLNVNGIRLCYDDVGEGSVPVIFLHGFPFDKNMWHSQVEFLKSTHRVIAYDTRGFGKSRDHGTTLSIDQFSEDLIRFMDLLSIDKAVVCGLSMGGYVAMNAHKRAPGRFEALILSDTQCVADTAEGKKKRYQSIDEINAEGIKNFAEGFIQRAFCNDSLTNKKQVVDQLKEVIYSTSPRMITQGLKALAERRETCSTLCNVSIPTLIICGKEDELTPVIQSEYMKQNIDRSMLCVIENAGHVSNLEQPEEFNKQLSDFLGMLSNQVEDLAEKQESAE